MKKNTIYAFGFMALTIGGLTACNSGTPENDSVDSAQKVNEVTQDNTAPAASTEDADFAVMATNAGMTEIEASKLALTTSANANVKKYAQMIVDEHTAAGSKLSALATSKNISVPTVLSTDSQDKINDLGKKTGKDFDKAYIDMMVSDHKDAVDAFQKENTNTTDGDLKAFTAETIPVLQKHLDDAKTWQSKM
jgi:putative membrane protein